MQISFRNIFTDTPQNTVLPAPWAPISPVQWHIKLTITIMSWEWEVPWGSWSWKDGAASCWHCPRGPLWSPSLAGHVLSPEGLWLHCWAAEYAGTRSTCWGPLPLLKSSADIHANPQPQIDTALIWTLPSNWRGKRGQEALGELSAATPASSGGVDVSASIAQACGWDCRELLGWEGLHLPRWFFVFFPLPSLSPPLSPIFCLLLALLCSPPFLFLLLPSLGNVLCGGFSALGSFKFLLLRCSQFQVSSQFFHQAFGSLHPAFTWKTHLTTV